MDKSTRTLIKHFPDAGIDTRLVVLGNATQIKIGKDPLQLTPYDVGDDQMLWAAYSRELDTIFIRLVQEHDSLF